jgi:hypothetical protein
MTAPIKPKSHGRGLARGRTAEQKTLRHVDDTIGHLGDRAWLRLQTAIVGRISEA